MTDPEFDPDAIQSRAAGRRVFVIIVGFFVTLIAADTLFVWLASSSHSGPVTEAAYDKGLDYNARLQAAAAEAALGWTMEVTAIRAADGASEILVAIKDADGAPLEGLDLSARLVRPVTSGLDQSLSFEPKGEGIYRVILDIPQPGQWELRVLARAGTEDGEDTSRFTKRLIL